MTTDARYHQLKTIFHSVSELPVVNRRAFLDESCAGNAELRRDVESLLAAHDDAAEFLEQPAFSSLVPDTPLPEGLLAGRYRLVREIGRGGMGVVYLANREDGEFRQQVAVKLVKRGMDSDLILRRFRTERQILAGLDHANIARLLDGGTTAEGSPYFVMEFIEGVAVHHYCIEHELTIAERCLLFQQVCAAVHFAHQRLVVHRDLKPANIIVTGDGIPKLLDFGIAKLLGDGASDDTAVPTAVAFRPMTPQYASPEQLTGGAVTTLSDVYSLGVILFELVTGEHPFRPDAHESQALSGPNTLRTKAPAASVALARAQSAGNGTSARVKRDRVAQVRGDIDNIIARAMHDDPARRYASAEQLSDDLRRHLSGLPVYARPESAAYLVGKFVRRNRIGVAAAALAISALATAAIVTTRQAQIASFERARAERRFEDVRRLATSFLFELHDAIRDLPGSTRARELLAKRTLVSLDALASEAQGDPSLQRDLAAAYIKIGDVLGLPYVPNLGQTGAALTSYEKSRDILTPLRALYPHDSLISRDLSVAHQRVGRMQTRARAIDSAILSERRALALSETLVASSPRNTEFRRLLGENYLFLGRAIYTNATAANTREGLALFNRSLAIREALLAESPMDASLQTSVAQSLESAGYAYWHLGDTSFDTSSYRSALATLQRAHLLRQTILAHDPANVRAQHAVPDGDREMAQLQTILGDNRAAALGFQTALKSFEHLAALDTANLEARTDIALAHQGLGEVLARLGNRVNAITHLRRATAILQLRYDADVENKEIQSYLFKARQSLALVSNR